MDVSVRNAVETVLLSDAELDQDSGGFLVQ